MPIPVIVVAVVAGASAVGTILTVRRIRKPMKIMVVGQGLTGKTTLINSWLGEWQEDLFRTADRVTVGTIKVDTGKKVLFVKKKFIFKKVLDISGQDESMRTFQNEIKAAKAIVYLIDAKHLRHEEIRPPDQGHADAWVRIIDDGSRLKRHCENAERVLLVVTHVDQDPRFHSWDLATYHAHVTEQLSGVISKIGNPSRTRVVVGSLKTEESAKLLSGKIVENLL